MLITVCDRQSYRVTRREYTDEGFLRVPGNVARTGIQQYLARELQLPGDPNRIVRVYRPADEVFNADSLASYDGTDVTVNHPDGLVNSENFRKVSAGVVRGVGRMAADGIHVECDLIVKDASAINSLNSGKCELSVGYTAEYDETPGVTADGEPYDFIQRNIKVNHVALVDRARAGSTAKVFDNEPTGGTMPVLITTDSGRAVDVADPANAQVVADAFDRLTKRTTDAEAERDAAKATADGLGEKLAAAEKLSSPEAINARVAAVAAVQVSARRIAGDAFTCDSVDPMEVMRAALTAKRPTIDWAGKSPAYVQAAYDMAVEELEKEEETTDAGGDGREKTVTGDAMTLAKQLMQLAKDGSGTTTTPTATVDSYTKFKEQQANAWKGK